MPSADWIGAALAASGLVVALLSGTAGRAENGVPVQQPELIRA
jgi:hypothetical protein